MKKTSSFLIISAGTLWGTMSVFVKSLENYGFNSMQISAFRIVTAAVIFIFTLFIYDRSLLIIKPADLPLFIAMGIISILCLAWTYFRAISYSVSVAAILLYTAPSMVMLMSVIFFKEKFTKRKFAALICAFCGCLCTAGNFKNISFNPLGILFGLAAGFTYATYSIFGTVLLKKYHPYTVTSVAFTFAAVGSLFVCNIPDVLFKISAVQDKLILTQWIIGIGVVTAVVPYILYTIGLSRTEAGQASVLASVEPLVASIIGIAFYGDKFSIMTTLGISLILSAVIILNVKKDRFPSNFGDK